MTRMIRVVLPYLLCALLVVGSFTAARLWPVRARGVAPAPAPIAQVDLSRTLQYLAEWARRDRWDAFPESPAFAFYNVYATRALGGSWPDGLRARVIDYLARCQGPDGGFSMSPGSGGSHVVPTLHALRALALLGALDVVDRPRAVSFLRGLALPSGGHRGRASDAEPSLGTTYHAVAALDLLGALHTVDRGPIVAYVSAHCTGEGGFALRPGMTAVSAGTFMAVRTLKLLGALSDQTAATVARYLASSRYSGRLRGGALPGLPEIEDEAHVLATLADLGRLDLVDRGEVERFVTSLYVGENGGFGPQPGLGTTPPSTYHAIACLVTLGRLPDPARG